MRCLLWRSGHIYVYEDEFGLINLCTHDYAICLLLDTNTYNDVVTISIDPLDEIDIPTNEDVEREVVEAIRGVLETSLIISCEE